MKLLTQKVEQIDHIATGAAARQARLHSGKSLRAVATKLGFSAPYLSDLERGRKNWNENLLRRFERAVK